MATFSASHLRDTAFAAWSARALDALLVVPVLAVIGLLYGGMRASEIVKRPER